MDAEEYMERNADEQMKHAEPLEKKKAKMAKKVGGWKVTAKVHPWAKHQEGKKFLGGSSPSKGDTKKFRPKGSPDVPSGTPGWDRE